MIKIKSTKKLLTPERVIREGIITREIDLFQIDPRTNNLSLVITERCYNDDGIVEWESTFSPSIIQLDPNMVVPIYAMFCQNLKAQTEAEQLFGCEIGDFEIIQDETTD